MMSNCFGLFINLDYAHKPQKKCTQVWDKIMDKMVKNDFSFKKRAFTIITEKNSDEVAIDVRHLLDEVEAEESDLYSYITDCYILNFSSCTDLTLPDTSNFDVEDIDYDDLSALGIEYQSLFIAPGH